MLKRVVDIEVAQSLAVYPTSAPEDTLNPLIGTTKASSTTNSEVDDRESSVANPGNKEDLAAVLDDAAETPVSLNAGLRLITKIVETPTSSAN